MKVWKGFGTEHSANLVIVGTFKTVDDANRVKSLIEEMTEIVRNEEIAGTIKPGESCNRFSQELMDCMTKYAFHSLDYLDPEQLLYEYSIEQIGNKIEVTIEDSKFQLMINAMINSGAKIEMFSAHNYAHKNSRN